MASNKPNPVSRNSETKDPIRRSFTGTPFGKPYSRGGGGGSNPNVPANSPSDFSRRGSISRESLGSLPDFEDKENSKGSNLKPVRARSPASASKGMKNFMSPTISAASKFATSPRKKILVERNEPVQSSVSFSETKFQAMEDNDSKPEIGLNQIESSHDSTITDLGHEETVKSGSVLDSDVLSDSKSDASSSLEDATENKDCVKLDPTFKISPRTSCPTSSPLMAPYDPKTNYLSPRPQFLHYRPNPRIESMLNKVKEKGKRLEECFASENSSDSEVSEILSENSLKQSDDISSEETVEEDEAVEEEVELNDSVQAKGESKSKFFTRSKFIAFVVCLVFACLSISISDSQVTDLSLSTLYVPPEITEFAKVTFEELVRKSQSWYANSFAYTCKLISSLRGMHKLGPLQYRNLTFLLEMDHFDDAGADFKFEKDAFAPIRERGVISEHVEEEGHEEIEEEEEENSPEFEEQVNQEIEDINEASEDHTPSVQVIKPGNLEAEQTQKTVESDVQNDMKLVQLMVISEADSEATSVQVIKPGNLEAEQTQETVESDVQNDMKLVQLMIISETTRNQTAVVVISEATENQPAVVISEAAENQPNVANLEMAEVQPEVSFAREPPQGETDVTSSVEIVSSKAEENSELDDASVDNLQNSAIFNGSENDYLINSSLGISISVVLLSLLVATAFFFTCAKKGKPTPNTTAPVDQPAQTKKLDSTFQESEVEMVGEPCPSEMSSFKSSSYTLKESSEAQSQERNQQQQQQQQPRKNYRRESLAAASSEFSLDCSPSYGSFTTYKKISSKGRGDDEAVTTPVRRSSRIIRKQGSVTSS